MKTEQNQPREKFTSKIGVILAAAGSAIGIGNIWRFSYVVGANGGGAFLLVYILCVVFVGLPLMAAELAIGRETKKSAVPAFREIAPKSFWTAAGAAGVLAAFLIMTYYPLVAGWSLGYMFESIVNWGPMTDNPEVFFSSYVSGTAKPLIVMAAALILTAFTLTGGVADGIERWCRILMPVFIVIICILIVRSLTLPGASEGVKFLFLPDFSKLTMGSFLDALGHGFYSLSVGMAVMITYGSYIGDNEDLTGTSVSVLALDTVTALMAGLAVFPAVFALGFEADYGAGLAFVTLPKTFSMMPFGQVFAVLFFLLLLVSALASMMSLLQVLTAFLEDEFGFRKRSILIFLTLLLFAAGIPSVLSFSSLSDFRIFGFTYFDFMDMISANIIVPVTGLLTAVFAAYRYGAARCSSQLQKGAKNPDSLFIKAFPFLIRYFVPVSVVLILLSAAGIF